MGSDSVDIVQDFDSSKVFRHFVDFVMHTGRSLLEHVLKLFANLVFLLFEHFDVVNHWLNYHFSVSLGHINVLLIDFIHGCDFGQ